MANPIQTAANVKRELKKVSTPKRKEANEWFFKTEKGQYGYGDKFIGVAVPDQRKVARAHKELPLPEITTLLESAIHEHRLTALFILVGQFKKATKHEDEKIRKQIYDFYYKNRKHVNNWDLVDSSAHYIMGNYLLDKPRDVLYKLVKSKNLWERRMSIIATMAFSDNNDFDDCLKISELLLKDEHDLIHKASGWILREVGKKDQKVLEQFLDKHAAVMPRTMLRYSLEKFSKAKKAKYMNAAK